MFDDNQKIITAKRLKELRETNKGKKLSHEKLHEELKKLNINVSVQSLKDYEVTDVYHSKFRATKGMSIETLYNLAEFYNVSVDYILGISDNFTTDDELNFVCNYTGLNEKAVIRISVMKNYCMDYDGMRVSGNDAFEVLNDYLSAFVSEAVSIYIAKMKEINEDYLLHCLIQRIYENDRPKYNESGEISLDMACFDYKKLSNDIKEKSEKCDMSYFRASRAYESFLKQYHCNTVSYYDIKDIYEKLYETFGYTKEQVDEKVKKIWKEYDKEGYKQWQP